MKKLAFTLAEVLLVIAIIGTVSVLTVNNAIKSTNTAEKITQLKRDALKQSGYNAFELNIYASRQLTLLVQSQSIFKIYM